jgi:hypothetical protein
MIFCICVRIFILGKNFHTWAGIFIPGQEFSYLGRNFHTWAGIFIPGQEF